MRIHRRELLRSAVGAVLGAGLVRSAHGRLAAGEETPPPIVDTHQHLWDLEKFRLPWVDSSKVLNRSFVTRDYLDAARGLGIVKAVYMEVAVEPRQHLAEALHVIDLCKRKDNPTCAAVIGGRPGSDGFREYIGRFKGSPWVKGVRQVLFGDPGACTREEYVSGVRFLGELGMSFDLCLPAGRLAEGLKLVESCPGTRFIVDHCGNADPKAFAAPPGEADGAAESKASRPSHDPDAWRRDMEKLARQKRVVCKISGIVARAEKGRWKAAHLAPIVHHCLDVFGPDRVMFGSDWPVCTRVATLREWVEALREIVRKRPAAEQRKLFHDNAVEFYGLK